MTDCKLAADTSILVRNNEFKIKRLEELVQLLNKRVSLLSDRLNIIEFSMESVSGEKEAD